MRDKRTFNNRPTMPLKSNVVRDNIVRSKIKLIICHASYITSLSESGQNSGTPEKNKNIFS